MAKPDRPCLLCGSLEFAVMKHAAVSVGNWHVWADLVMCMQCGRMDWVVNDPKKTAERVGGELVQVPAGQPFR
jgi:hypothetical protein